MNFLSKLFKSVKPPRYKICKYPDGNGGYKYAAFYDEIGGWWCIKQDGTTSVSEDHIHGTGYFYKTMEEAGEVVNKHATNGGSQTVWRG